MIIWSFWFPKCKLQMYIFKKINNFKLMALTTEYISSDFAPSVSDKADMERWGFF